MAVPAPTAPAGKLPIGRSPDSRTGTSRFRRHRLPGLASSGHWCACVRLPLRGQCGHRRLSRLTHFP